ncbi:MAG: 50S ribosomal protein L18 [Bdellovibrionota bacterium]
MKKISKRVSDSVRNRVRRRKRISFKVKGTAERPRLAVFRSNTAFYAQIIDDDKAQTLVALSTNGKDLKGKTKNTKDGVKALGAAIAKKASAAKIDKVVFDRAGYLYHGKVKAFADGAREGGLKF